jgi:hypothetical protein
VPIVNAAEAAPAGTVTVAATVTGSPPLKTTTAPPSWAAPFNVAVPVTELPPTTLAALSVSEVSPTPVVTLSDGDVWLLPLTDAVIVAEPDAIPVTLITALSAPAGTLTGLCTVATPVLLLEAEILKPPAGAAALSATVACTVAPTLTLAAFSVTREIVPVPLGAEGAPDPQAVKRRPNINAAGNQNRLPR